MKRNFRYASQLAISLLLPGLLSACGSDVGSDSFPTSPPMEEVLVPPPVTGDEPFTIRLESASLDITEGQGLVSLPVTLARSAGHEGNVTLEAVGETAGDELFLSRQFVDASLSDGETGTELQLALSIAHRPIQPQTRTLLVIASDSDGGSSTARLSLQVQPTTAPDVYLLIGQSNMIGISEEDARQSAPGEADAPVATIRQLNVTFNDDNNFSEVDDFTDPAMLFNTSNPLTIALDPLHTGLQSNGSKSGTRIGMGLSFAKRALSDTTADIFLVPAAWSDTGFCVRDTNSIPGLGWNATIKRNPAISGTLLHDRAIARANIALDLTGGILRGILWHQGEADSENSACAQSYAANLTEMVESLRTNINPDARGPEARGPEAIVPFILGTMSMGGEQAPFTDKKTLVDSAHRSVATELSFADFVNNDDLIPPAFACGGGSCIHFGAEALREMGARYYERLVAVTP